MCSDTLKLTKLPEDAPPGRSRWSQSFQEELTAQSLSSASCESRIGVEPSLPKEAICIYFNEHLQ